MNLNNFEYAPTNASRTQTRVNVKVRGRSYSRSELASKSGGGPRAFSRPYRGRHHDTAICVRTNIYLIRFAISRFGVKHGEVGTSNGASDQTMSFIERTELLSR